MNSVEGTLDASGKKYAIISGRFNDFFGEQLIRGATDALVRHGASDDAITLYRCPGAFEVPIVAERHAKAGGFDAIICLGVLIRGATPHFDYIAAEATKGVGAVAMKYAAAVSYGIITCDNMEQAIERSGSKAGNKGAEAALAAVEMANLFSEIDSAS